MAEYIDIDTPLELKVVWGQTYKPYTSTLRELLDINSIPYTAADVRPVVRGKWIQDCDYHFRCSACGDRWTVSNGHPLDVANGWNYCPNCGADMRGENDV